MAERTNPRADLYVGPEHTARASRAELRAGRKGLLLISVWTIAVIGFTGYAEQAGMYIWVGTTTFVFSLSMLAFTLWWRRFLVGLRSGQGRSTP